MQKVLHKYRQLTQAADLSLSWKMGWLYVLIEIMLQISREEYY